MFEKREEESPELKNMLDNLEWVKNFLNKYEFKLENKRKEAKIRFFRGF